MLTATPSRRFFAFASVAVFAIVFVVFTLYERPALGLGHFFYFAIALAALAGGRRVGVGAGFLSAGLYAAGVLLNSHVPSSSVPTLPTVIRAVTFVAIGWLIGWFAETHRRMVAELSVLAERDAVTGLPNTRAFEIAVDRRLNAARPFTLLVGDIDALDDSGSQIGPDESLRALSDLLSRSLEPDDDIARIGGAEFAVLTTRRVGKDASDLALQLERVARNGDFQVTFGWASFPQDGENALSLYRAADERLYARKLVAGSARRGTLTAVGGSGRRSVRDLMP
ncbi:MAG: GGDEF domain-containing protein [Thermoleophilia bacterium]